MYYPYFHGREMELSAISTACGDFGSPQQIVPVIEPAIGPTGQVSRYVGKFNRTLAALQGAGGCAYVVMNPHQGGFSTPANVAAWTSGTATMLADPSVVRPTFKVRPGAIPAELTAFVTAHTGRDMGIVVADERAITATQMATAVGTESVQVFVHPEVDSAALVGAFGAGRVVRVRNNFPSQPRNADYSGTAFFGDNHLTDPGGFSDFTVLPATVTFSGGRTGAAVVHLTYKVANDEFWVEHFVSDEKDVTQGTFQSKLLEALTHMDTDITANPTKFETSPTVTDYQTQLATGRATSQGKNKELLIEHHLYVVARHLGI